MLEDVVTAKELSSSATATVKRVCDLSSKEMILDLGPQTTALYAKEIGAAATIVWNGPVGVFEFAQFSDATETRARTIASDKAFSIAADGDTLAAITKYGIAKDIGYICTGGGAFLEFIGGKVLPAVAVLELRGD